MGNIFTNNPYFTAYHITNTIGLLLYPIYRTKVNTGFSESLTGNREYQIMIITSIIAFIKFFKSITWEEWINNLFVYGKAGSALLFIFKDYRLGIWYIIFCVIVWIFIKIPHYTGPSKIQEIYFQEHFDSLFLKENEYKLLPKGVLINMILFYANWSDVSLYVFLLRI